MGADSPDVATAKGLLDQLKLRGFTFHRIAPGEDGPLVGHRAGGDWADVIYIEGFSYDCCAWRQRRSSLVVPGKGLIQRHVEGSALMVLHEVLAWDVSS
jgi:hypothetical protein